MRIRIIIIAFLSSFLSKAQVILTEGSPSSTINFSASMPATVGNGAFTASGFQPNPTAGQLDSDAWQVTGWSDGGLSFGGSQTQTIPAIDYTRGNATVAVTTGGFYSYRSAPQSVANPCLLIQAGGGDFEPGTLTLKIKNNGTTSITELAVSYNLFVRNDMARSNSFNFSYSSDNISYITVPSLDYISPTTADALGWVQVGTSPSRATTIIGLNVIPGGVAFIRWTCATASGINARDEFGLDDIECTATYTTGCTTPINQPSLLSALNTTFTGSDFAWTNGGGSDGSVLVIRPSGSPEVPPVNGGYYVPSANWGLAPETVLGSNNRVISQQFSASSAIGVSGLTPGTQYFATVYSYNIPYCFLLPSSETVTFYTPSLEPTSFTGFSGCLPFSGSQINVLFPAASTITNAAGYVIIMRIGAAPTGFPVDGILYNPGDIIGDTTIAGYVNNTTATAFAATGLSNGSTYNFMIIPFGGTLGLGPTYNYKVNTPVPKTICNTNVAPEINVRGIIAANPSIPDGNTTVSGLNNTQFGTVLVGNSQTKNFKIENNGNAPLTINSITFVGGNSGDFILVGATPTFPLVFPLTIIAGSSITISISFSPTAVGVRNTTLTIVNDDTNETPYDFLIQGNATNVSLLDINIKGNGQSIPDNSVFPSGTNWTAFGLAVVGSSTVTRTFTIENLGSTNLNLNGTPIVSITGTNASQFTVSVQPSVIIVGGGSFITFDVLFNPTSGGIKNATINISNTDSDENPYNFNINGNAKGANNIYVYGNGNDVIKGSTTTSVTNLTNFGAIAVTTGLKQNTFIISNLSGSTRYLTNSSITGLNASMFSIIANPSNNAIGNGNSTSITINFTPTSAGLKTALVSFECYTNSALTSPDTIDPIYTFAISGNGSVYISCNNSAVQTIAIQNFETPAATPTWGYSYTTDGDPAINGGSFDNGTGAKDAFIGSKAFQFASAINGTLTSATIDMNAIDTSQHNNINLSFKVAAFRGIAGQGMDVQDYIGVQTSIDGGINWSTEATLKGYANSRWSFDATGVFNAFYTGTNNGATIDTRNGNAELPNGLSTFFLKNLPAVSSLLIRIVIANDRPDEIWVIDNVKLEGQIYQSSTWNGSTWLSGFPTTSTKAIFANNYITNALPNHGSVKACECEIKTGANVIVDSNYYLEIQNNLKTKGILTFENNASLIQINDGAVNEGNITYKRNTSLRQYDYSYWSTPVIDFDIANLFLTPPSMMISWRTTGINNNLTEGDWLDFSGLMVQGTGYALRSPDSFDPITPTLYPGTFFGKPNNGIIPVTINRGSYQGGLATTANNSQIDNFSDNYNLLGNPYASAISASQFLFDNRTKLEGNVSFWTHGNLPVYTQSPFYDNFLFNYTDTDYFTYTFTGTSCCPAAAADVFIGAGQGFFVAMKDGIAGSDTIEFNNAMRNTTYSNSTFYKNNSQNKTITDLERHRIWLDINSPSNYHERTLVGYIEGATNDRDSFFDFNSLLTGSIAIYTINKSENYLIQGKALPFSDDEIIPIGFYAPEDGQFNIAIGGVDGVFENQNIYLEDQLLNVIHNLKTSPYPFNTNIGANDNRFVLRFTNSGSMPETNELANSVMVTTPNNNINIKSFNEKIDTVSVFDLLGREIVSKENVMNTEIKINSITAKKQVLVVKIKLKNGDIVNKKVILN